MSWSAVPRKLRWLPTSAISRATLAAGHRFDSGMAASQHVEMVSAYEDAGVRCHFLEPDPALPYQVFARDSSAMGPNGTFITQLSQWWRRGEYAPVLRFYAAAGIPIFRMTTAAALEGGDVMIVEPGTVLIGVGEERTQEPAARQLAGWFEEQGWEARGADSEPLRPHRRPRRDPRRQAGRRLHRGALALAGRLAAGPRLSS